LLDLLVLKMTWAVVVGSYGRVVVRKSTAELRLNSEDLDVDS